MKSRDQVTMFHSPPTCAYGICNAARLPGYVGCQACLDEEARSIGHRDWAALVASSQRVRTA